jgi:RimJ/RimL family protein N-acetyltransferase
MLDAALIDDDELGRVLGHRVAPGWATFREALQPVRDALATKPADFAWGPRFFVTDDPIELIGWGGFKGAPRDGVVELGYEIAASHWGRGFATAVTRAMVDEAFDAADVTSVIAHTLPEQNASNRVLEKVGFVFDRSVQDDDETVWRFALAVSSPSG